MSESPVAHVDLAAIRHNLARVRDRVAADTKILAAVKADAYGHGLVPVSRALEAAGVAFFGVATPAEAMALREAGVQAGLLLLSPVRDAATITRLVDADVSLTATDAASLDAYARADAPGQRKLHLKVDTGMGRLGRQWRDTTELARAIDRRPDWVLEGVWTHFAASDDEDRSYTLGQIEAYRNALEALDAAGLTPPLRHAANSAAIVAYPEAAFDMVRPGICLYGYHSSDVVAALEPGLRPAMRLAAPVTFVKRVTAGTSVSYGNLWRAPQATTVATVRIGYADGYARSLSGKAWVSVQGERRPVVGRVCMDQIMVDVGDLGVAPGDEVTLWGPPGPDAESLARAIGTVSYELLTGVGARVERAYTG
ncbi:MAG: alanine racemase [Trueperaceae bacterium]